LEFLFFLFFYISNTTLSHEYNNLLEQYNSAFVQYQGEPVTYYAAGRG